MPLVIGKARNEVFRTCAPKPVREATLRVRCGVTRRFSGTTTARSSRLAARPAKLASRPCGLMRWVLVASCKYVTAVKGFLVKNDHTC